MIRACHALVILGAALAIGNEATAHQEKGKDRQRVRIEFRLAEKEPAVGLEEMEAPKTKDKIFVRKDAALSNVDIAEARVVKNALEQPAIGITFVEGSRKKVAEFSGSNVGKIAAIFIDGKLVSAPVIREKFSERAEITGDFTQAEAERIANGINGKK